MTAHNEHWPHGEHPLNTVTLEILCDYPLSRKISGYLVIDNTDQVRTIHRTLAEALEYAHTYPCDHILLTSPVDHGHSTVLGVIIPPPEDLQIGKGKVTTPESLSKRNDR